MTYTIEGLRIISDEDIRGFVQTASTTLRDQVASRVKPLIYETHPTLMVPETKFESDDREAE